MRKNILLATDSYKLSHFKQYPAGTEGMMSYIEARGGVRTVFFGLQMFIKDYLMEPFTAEDITEAAMFAEGHGEPFNREGWEYILNEYNGYMPVLIKAIPEGTVTPNRNALVTIECIDPKCFWVASYLETALLRAVWYGTTVATNSYECKQIIKKYLDLTSDNPEQIAFKLHDFGARGVSSAESAAMGGAAHLVNFMGSDTIEGIIAANRYYGVATGMAGFSIPAAEHSTITSWGKENEVDAYRNMIKQYGGPGKILAVVSDSYDIFKACHLWGTVLKEDVINSGGTVVIRPDSGEPAPTVLECVRILAEHYGTTTNSKGYKVLPDCIRVIQGDGINNASINEILSTLKWHGFAADNVAFGMGGALLQGINRDTYGFAMKCCSLLINGEWKDVFKEATGKASKRGRLVTVRVNGEVETRRYEECGWKDGEILERILKPVFWVTDGKPVLIPITFDEVRANSNK
jgi:nicotinamide phosphoribosyltransferase